MLEQAETRMTPVTIHPMEYRSIVAAGLASPEPTTDAAPNPKELEARIRELQLELEARSRNFEAGIHSARIEAQEAGRNSERSEHASRVAMAAQALTAALEDFIASRDYYLAQVEQEVVRLALAIAARILHREALMDPLLLAGAVRVALGQLADTTEVCLKVPASEHEMWREMLHLMPNLPLHPKLFEDDALTTGECLLETQLGSVDLGVRSQLAEIERGFFDLLEYRSKEQREQKDQRRQRSNPGSSWASESPSQENPL
jgi:flagellar assembly protein FliH